MNDAYRISLTQYESDGYVPIHLALIGAGKNMSARYHDHDFSEIAIVMGGSAIHSVSLTNNKEAVQAKIAKGDILVLHPGVFHLYKQAEDLELWNIIFDSKHLLMPQYDAEFLPFFQKLFPQKTPPPVRQMTFPVLHLDDKELNTCQNSILKIQQEMTSQLPGSYFSAMSAFMGMLIHLARMDREPVQDKETAPESRIADALNYIHRHYMNGKISLDMLAAIASMSKRNLTRYFRNATGASPLEYLQTLRMSKALFFLRSTDFKIEDIAYRCGFCNGAYFSRCFIKSYNVSPSEYRRNNQVLQIKANSTEAEQP